MARWSDQAAAGDSRRKSVPVVNKIPVALNNPNSTNEAIPVAREVTQAQGKLVEIVGAVVVVGVGVV